MKQLRAIFIISTVVLIASLLLARTHPFGDPGLQRTVPSPTAFAKNAAVPADVRSLLVQKCGDCHTEERRLPFYDRVAIHLAPASWLIENDVVQGRRAMDLDAWASYSVDKQQDLAARSVKLTRSHEMPLLQYRILHGVRITDADIQTLSQWARGLQDIEPEAMSPPVPAMKPAAVHVQSPQLNASGDPVRGKDVFGRRCVGCHAVNGKGDGPPLQGVYGHSAGAVPDFDYSTALQRSHISWDDGTLEKWLANPDTLVPGNDMDFHVSKPQERKDIIAYLKQSAGK